MTRVRSFRLRFLPHVFARLFHRWSLKARIGRPRLKAGIVLFSVARNEALRLPHFLEYYRSLGISQMVVADHGSSDATAAILRAGGAVMIPVRGNFIHKDVWLTAMVEAYGRGRWCLIVDIDEFLVFPRQEDLGIAGLCAYLEDRGATGFACKLVDMFPEGSVEKATPLPERTLLEAAPLFDPDLGTRRRHFGIDPYLDKVPIFRFKRGMRLKRGQHVLPGARLAAATGALLHFKFLSDFAPSRTCDRAFQARRARHLDAVYAAETESYAEKTETTRGLCLATDGAVRYQGWKQLAELGVISVPDDMATFADLTPLVPV